MALESCISGVANGEHFFCYSGCKATCCDPSLPSELAFKNRPAIHSAFVFDLASAGGLAFEAALETHKRQLVAACHILGAAYGYLMHAPSLHSSGKP